VQSCRQHESKISVIRAKAEKLVGKDKDKHKGKSGRHRVGKKAAATSSSDDEADERVWWHCRFMYTILSIHSHALPRKPFCLKFFA
jgi:hypothetical protein